MVKYLEDGRVSMGQPRPNHRGRAPASPNFRNLIHVRTRYERPYPYLRGHETRRKEFLQGRLRPCSGQTF